MTGNMMPPEFRLEYLVFLSAGLSFSQAIENFCNIFILQKEEMEPAYISGSGDDFSFRSKIVNSNSGVASSAVLLFVETEDEYSLQTAKEMIEEKTGAVFANAILLRDTVGEARTIEAYKLINELENALRKLVALRLASLSGQNWWSTRVQMHIRQHNGHYQYENYRNNEVNDPELTPPNELAHHDLFYIDLSELKKVIEEQGNWQDGFVADLKVLKSIDRLDMLNRLRRKIAHNRFLSQRNLDDLKTIHGQLMHLCRRLDF